MIFYNFNKINLDTKIILRSELQVTYDVVGRDLNYTMMHVMYISNLDQIYACLVIKHRSENQILRSKNFMTYDIYFT